jgi:hypothetical protein
VIIGASFRFYRNTRSNAKPIEAGKRGVAGYYQLDLGRKIFAVPSNLHHWLDQNAGAEGWAMTPSGARGVVNDAIAVYFADATIASAIVARWCVGQKAEVAKGLLRVHENESPSRKIAAHHSSLSRAGGREA